MTKVLKNLSTELGNYLAKGYIYFTLGWVFTALIIQLYFISLTAYDSYYDTNKAGELSKEISIRIDGTFRDNPKNIWYKK